jgi:hypothetical protein
VPIPWTQSLHLTWRPELRFYERQVALLKRFEEQGILRAFRVEEGSIDAQLFQSRDRLTIKKDGADLQLFSQEADPGPALESLRIALEEVEPVYPRMISASFQYIIKLDLSFDQAVERGRERVLSPLPGTLQHQDWAILSDVALPELDASGTVEFGIIRRHEAPNRLARIAGRAGAQQRQALPRWEDEEFPEVAVFCDGALHGSLEGASDPLASFASQFWDAARSAQGSLAEGLCTILMTDDVRKVEAK